MPRRFGSVRQPRLQLESYRCRVVCSRATVPRSRTCDACARARHANTPTHTRIHTPTRPATYAFVPQIYPVADVLAQKLELVAKSEMVDFTMDIAKKINNGTPTRKPCSSTSAHSIAWQCRMRWRDAFPSISCPTGPTSALPLAEEDLRTQPHIHRSLSRSLNRRFFLQNAI